MQEIKQQLTTEEELFCIRYELEILSGIVNHNRLERWLPGFCSTHTHEEHAARYNWVKDFVKDKTVLDIACGTGFGSYTLAKDGNAANVTAWDIDEKTIQYASLRNKHSNLIFEVRDAEAFETDKQYEIITSFETIEHLKKPEQFLTSINRSLTGKGIFFISTPISNMAENNYPDNIYHEKEWGFKRFRDLVAEYLNIEEVYLQLYSVRQAFDTGFFSKALQKIGLKHNDRLPVIEKLIPHRWNPQELNEDSVGKEWTGYQILQCRKKTDARA